MHWLRQSTGMDIRVGPAIATDGVTPVTTLALGTADQAEALKHNGAATVDISSNTFAAVTGCDGWYDLTLTTTDTNTLGQLDIVIQDSSLMLPIFKSFMVVPSNVWDSLFGSDILDVSVTQWLGTAAATPNTAGVPEVDITYINGNAEAAQKLSAAGRALTLATVQTSSTATSIITNITGMPDNAFNGRVMTLYDQATLGEQTVSIDDFVGATGTFTVSGFTSAPSNGDLVVIS